MGLGDEIKNKTQQAAGKVKEGVGDLTNNEQLEAEGKKDQLAGQAKDAVNDAKEGAAGAFNDAVDGARGDRR